MSLQSPQDWVFLCQSLLCFYSAWVPQWNFLHRFWRCLSSWRDCACYKTLQSGDSPAWVWSRENDLLLNWGWPGQERPGFFPKRRFGQRLLGRCFLARETSAFGRQDWHSSTKKCSQERQTSRVIPTQGRQKSDPKSASRSGFFCFFSCFSSGELHHEKHQREHKKSHQRSRPRAQKIAPEVPTQEPFPRGPGHASGRNFLVVSLVRSRACPPGQSSTRRRPRFAPTGWQVQGSSF